MSRVQFIFLILVLFLRHGCIAFFKCFTACKEGESLYNEKDLALFHVCTLNTLKLQILGFETLVWKKMGEPIGRCQKTNCKQSACQYNCQPESLDSANPYEFGTCGVYCFSLSLRQISQADYGAYYISLLSPDLISTELVLNLTVPKTTTEPFTTDISTTAHLTHEYNLTTTGQNNVTSQGINRFESHGRKHFIL